MSIEPYFNTFEDNTCPVGVEPALPGQTLSAKFSGSGYARLPTVNYSETVNIALSLPDGRVHSKPRRFMHAAPPKLGMPTSTVQVDHESGGLLMDGVRKTCNGEVA